MVFQLSRELDARNAAAGVLLDKIQQFPVCLVGFCGFGLLLVGLQAQVLGDHVAEPFFRIHAQNLDHELVHVVIEAENVVAMGPDLLGLGQLRRALHGAGYSVVDELLRLGHGVGVFLQGDQLLPVGGVVQQQVAEEIPLESDTIPYDAVF